MCTDVPLQADFRRIRAQRRGVVHRSGRPSPLSCRVQQSPHVAFDVPAAVGPDGWATVPDLLQRVSRRTIARWVADGRLIQVRPGVLALPSTAVHWRTRVAAALEGREAVASHATALALWELVQHPPGPVHVTVEPGRSGRGPGDVVVHRAPGAFADRRRVGGLAITSVERSVVETWGRPGGIPRSDVRAAATAAVRTRQCSPQDLAAELAARPRLPGRAELSRLISLLADGCRSELEIWGCLHVLQGPGMPPFVQQRRVAVAGRTFFLDAAYEEVLLAVEMDGAAWHGSRAQRERDISRDALLATVGWQTLRFGFARMTRSPDACRRDVLAVHSARQRLFSGDSVR